MASQLTTNGDALRLFFTDDIYLIRGEEILSTDEVIVSENQSVITVSEPEVSPVISLPLPVETPQESPSFKFLGKNSRNILILVNDPEHEVSDEKGRELLRKIVKSVNLSANDFALLNYAGYIGTSYAQLQQHFSSVLIFVFGVTPEQLKMKAYPQNSIVLEEGVRLIFSSELKTLEEDPAGKKVLWASLKQLGL
jgi:DNA polymerase III psi subunit